MACDSGRMHGLDRASSPERSAWVLDAGLPPLPDRVGPDDSVPVAFWAGPVFGAVLNVWGCDHDPDCPPEEHLATSTQCFKRTPNGWEFAGVSAGTDWPTPGLRGLVLSDDAVVFDVESVQTVRGPDDGWTCSAVDGVVGASAVWIELTQDGDVVRQKIEAPTGAVVVAMSNTSEALIRTFDRAGAVLWSLTVPPHPI